MSMSILIGLLIGAQSVAQPKPLPAAPAQRPAPAEQLSEILSYFAGSWSGSGQFVKSGKPLRSTYVFTPTLDGEALRVRHEELAPNTFAFEGIISVDTVSGKPVMMIGSNKGSGARLFRSAGWDSDKIIFETDAALHTWFARERFIFVRLDTRSFQAVYQMSRDNGVSWKTGDEQLFVKSAASAASGASIPPQE